MPARTLTHGQVIRLALWTPMTFAHVGTLEGFRAEGSGDLPAALERAQRNGHKIAWTVYTGAAVVDEGGAYYARQQAEAAKATTLADGDRVEIEGRPYRVAVHRASHHHPAVSNPISFVPLS